MSDLGGTRLVAFLAWIQIKYAKSKLALSKILPAELDEIVR